ncbi:TonB-dependent receptor domain-containing protein [Massilia sp. LXY-6]|uniref:TonB-dependent receptor domain-containing protein n=1 Tax=Massilia sp. LXY-6 TaxID=3379823 RepID=UPI003EE185DE
MGETSKQFSVGIRLEPSPSLSMGLDLWDVTIRNAVSGISQRHAFGDPVKFRDLFTTYTEPSTGNTYWAFKSLSVNIGRQHNRGIDWDAMSRYKFDWATFTATVNGTHMLRSDYRLPGTDNQRTNSMDFFDVNNSVTFRNLARLSGTLDTGKLSNTLMLNYRNGYTDASVRVRNTPTNVNETIRLDVPSYITLDWQGRYRVNKAITLRLGVKPAGQAVAAAAACIGGPPGRLRPALCGSAGPPALCRGQLQVPNWKQPCRWTEVWRRDRFVVVLFPHSLAPSWDVVARRRRSFLQGRMRSSVSRDMLCSRRSFAQKGLVRSHHGLL